jgi:hypothetical protein
MAVARDNEKIFSQNFSEKVGNVNLLDGRAFSKKDHKNRKLSSSVDHHFQLDGREILIEIDSYNMAKVVVGQYLLINILSSEKLNNPLFLVIHTYKDYKPERTIKYLEYVNTALLKETGMPFGVIHMDKFFNWQGGDAASFIKLFDI